MSKVKEECRSKAGAECASKMKEDYGRKVNLLFRIIFSFVCSFVCLFVCLFVMCLLVCSFVCCLLVCLFVCFVCLLFVRLSVPAGISAVSAALIPAAPSSYRTWLRRNLLKCM